MLISNSNEYMNHKLWHFGQTKFDRAETTTQMVLGRVTGQDWPTDGDIAEYIPRFHDPVNDSPIQPFTLE